MRLVLILLRHGEAVEGTSSSKDHGRVLTARGQRQAEAAGQRLTAAGHHPTLALVSDAARTQQTWAGAVAGGGALLAGAQAVSEHLIYSGETAELAQLIANVAASQHACVLLVGHNPSISELASDLSGDYLRFAPGECAVLTVEAAGWSEAIEEQAGFTVAALFKSSP